MRSLLISARRVAVENNASAALILADVPYEFGEFTEYLKKVQILVATDKEEVAEAAKEDGLSVVPLLDEPQTRQHQLSQSLLEAIADDLLQSGDQVVTVYSVFDRDSLDSLSIVNLDEHLSKLTARDLRRLETQVPLETLRIIVDLAVEIGREGREGHSVGTLLIVGQHRKVMELSHEAVHDPFKGYKKEERLIRSPRVRESIKELACIDGAFIVSSDGAAIAAGRIIDAPKANLTLSKGLGARHWAAAAISKVTNAIAIAVSESTGTVRLFQNGIVVLRIEPMDQALKWDDLETEAPE